MSTASVSQRIAAYQLFAQYREPSEDTVPQRHTEEQVGGFVNRHLVTDETEWLARPDLWGAELLGQRKIRLAEIHTLNWLATNFLECCWCRQLVHEIWGSGVLDESALQTEKWVRYFTWATQQRQRQQRVQPPECLCGWTTSVYKTCFFYARGLITGTELFNKLLEDLSLFARRELLLRPRSEMTDDLSTRRQAAWDFGRNLALEMCGPNPFRPITFPDSWRSESAVSLARTAYDTRNFSLMPILADALEEAGCDNADVLTHCHDPKQIHVRGCWVADGVLGKS